MKRFIMIHLGSLGMDHEVDTRNHDKRLEQLQLQLLISRKLLNSLSTIKSILRFRFTNLYREQETDRSLEFRCSYHLILYSNTNFIGINRLKSDYNKNSINYGKFSKKKLWQVCCVISYSFSYPSNCCLYHERSLRIISVIFNISGINDQICAYRN